jgi:hypothetical protein
MHNTKPRTLGPTAFRWRVDWELMWFIFWIGLVRLSLAIEFSSLPFHLLVWTESVVAAFVVVLIPWGCRCAMLLRCMADRQ